MPARRVSRHAAPSLPDDELRWRFSRSSGPGGQHVNTSETRVELSLDLATTTMLTPEERARALRRLEKRLSDGVLTVSAQRHRSQARNRELARERLAELVSWAIAPPPRRSRPRGPTRAAKERRLAEKRRRSETKQARGRPRDHRD